jgi:hypothetical protein
LAPPCAELDALLRLRRHRGCNPACAGLPGVRGVDSTSGAQSRARCRDVTARELLSRLEGVKRTAPGRWIARCPAHEDRKASLSVRELEDGRVLLHDFAGCSTHEVLAAAGLEISDLFPEREQHHGKPERRPFPAADVLRGVGFEALVVAAAASAMLAGEPLSAVDRERLMLAASRLQGALDLAGVRRHA